ncbi:MAG: potassium-transporting ATPase subunit KdpC [Bacteroidetes bacterium]|nr:potassium-transporting ATPase subunit KdpC [Bacteroidota bacterium]
MNSSNNNTLIALKMIVFFTILTGLLYPLLITSLAQVAFPSEANGSLKLKNGKVIGSELIGQSFNDSVYFWSRPSSSGYNAMPGSGSNLGPTSAMLKKMVEERKKNFITLNHLDNSVSIPSEMLFASGSGLDPHISKQSAILQVNRVATARKMSREQKEQLISLIEKHTEPPQLSLFGEERVNVLMLNLDVDKIKQ